MEKTKLGLSVPVLSALTYLLFLFGGYTPALLLVGYILLCESDISLKKTAVTATAVALAFSAVNALIGLLPSLIDVFEALFIIFGDYLGISFVDNIANFLYTVLSLLKTVVMIYLAGLAVLAKPLKLKLIDKLID